MWFVFEIGLISLNKWLYPYGFVINVCKLVNSNEFDHNWAIYTVLGGVYWDNMNPVGCPPYHPWVHP